MTYFMTQMVTVTFVVGFDLVYDPIGHKVIRGRRDLLYDPKGHGDLCGLFDLVYDPNGHRIIRSRRNIPYDPKRSR